MQDYPLQERIKKRLEPVVELAVEGGIRNIVDYTISVDVMMSKGGQVTTLRKIFER